MSDTYTKLFSSITASTIVSEPVATRWAWVTMLAAVKPDGCVYGSVPGLARLANITLEEIKIALACFLAPDPYSRTQDHEGRRIEVIDGGWRLLNHAKYDEIRSEAERAEYKRNWDREHRPSGWQRAKQSDSQSDSPTDRPTKPDSPTASTSSSTYKEEDQKKEHARTRRASQPTNLLADVSEQIAADFTALRKQKRAPLTATAIEGIRREATKAGLTLDAALAVCCERGWTGFRADWDWRATAGPQKNGATSKAGQAIEYLERLKNGQPKPDSGAHATIVVPRIGETAGS